MKITVEVEFTPLYELIASLAAYSNPKLSRSLYLDKSWWTKVKRMVPPLPFKGGPLRDGDSHGGAVLLIRAASAHHDSPAVFTQWLRRQTIDDLRSIIGPYFTTFPFQTASELVAYRNALGDLIDFWSEHYLPSMNPALLSGLARHAEVGQELARRCDPIEVIEELTGGIRLGERPEDHRILLIPQYHCRPINLYFNFHGLTLFLYPAEALPPEPGEVPRELLRVTAALADSSRLKILRLVANKPLNFTDLVGQTGLAKSTVHHHLVILRAAGLLWVHDRFETNAVFELRPTVGDLVKNRLVAYLRGEEP